MSTGDRFDRQDPFEQHVDFDESMDRVKREGQRGIVGRFVARVRALFR
jgi:hypothetical protein